MSKIGDIYVEIRGDARQLKADLGQATAYVTEASHKMATDLKQGLSAGQIQSGLKSMVHNLSDLNRAAKAGGVSLKGLEVDLKALQGVTGLTKTEFEQLQRQFLETRTAQVQEKALRGIARQAGLTAAQIRELGTTMGVSSPQIENVVGASGKAEASIKRIGNSVDGTVEKMKTMIATVATYSIAFAAVAGVVQAIREEFTLGFKSIEEFRLGVASSASFITSFSERARSGDLAGGYKEAAEYAEKLAQKLEMIDSKTVASGKDLQMMSETFIQHGVLLDINNEKQVQGFTNIATALALVTAGQNKDVQIRQEINALLLGQARATDRLPRLLAAQDPYLKEHLELWRRQGTLIENVGKMLEGFAAGEGTLSTLWVTVGSTMETINRRILRGAFEPAFKDLIDLARDFSATLMDAEGQLTPLAEGLQKNIAGFYTTATKLAKDYGGELVALAKWLIAAKAAQIALNLAVGRNPYVAAAAGLLALNNQLKDYQLNIGSLETKYKKSMEYFKNAFEGLDGTRDPNSGRILTEREKAIGKIAELERSLAKDKSLYFDEEKSRVSRIKTEIVDLQNQIALMDNSAKTSFSDKMTGLAGNYGKIQVPKLIDPRIKELEDQEAKTNALIMGMNYKSNAQQTPMDPWQKSMELRDKAIKDSMKNTREVKEHNKTILDEYDDIDRALNKYFNDIDKVAKKEAEQSAELEKRMTATNMYIAGLNGIEASKSVAMDSWQKNFELREEYQKKSLENMEDNEKSFSQAAREAVTGWASDFSGSLNDMLWKADATFADILESFGRMLTQMVIQKSIVEPLVNGMLNFMPSAQGNVFAGPGISAYSNQVVSQPTVFPFATGIGLMGEAGSEAILPLKRGKNGNLGVEGSGSVTNVIIHNNGGGTVTQKEKPNDTGGVDLEIVFDNMMAKNVGRTGSATNRALMATTGSSQPLMRR